MKQGHSGISMVFGSRGSGYQYSGFRRYWFACAVAAAFICCAGGALVFGEIRAARVAGQFYPAEPAELAQFVNQALQPHAVLATGRKPRIVIVPHAGYQYSGAIAAGAFRQVQGHAYDGVVVIGFMHRIQFPGASVDTREAYQTPLGLIPVDQAAAALLQTYPGVTHEEAAHAGEEHSLEVELPFLQSALKETKLVAVLMGTASAGDAERLATALAALARTGDYLFVFSTDLSHYHPYEDARTIDQRTVNALLFETPHALARLFDGGVIEACGRGPLLASLFLAAKLGYLERRLVVYANSGDTTPERSRVVGYAALVMYDRPPVAGAPLSPQAGQALVGAARLALKRMAGRQPVMADVDLGWLPELAQPRGLFVTLRKQGWLRGCIGRIQTDEPLASSISAVAVDAALHDSRFPPVTAGELPELQVEVSVLTKPVPLADVNDLVAGRDGIILDAQGHRGVFLPQVWAETGWTRVEFLRELASQKAGLPPDAWKQAALSVFQDQAFEEPLPDPVPAPSIATEPATLVH